MTRSHPPWVDVAARFAWPAAVVIVVALVLGFLRSRPAPKPESTVRVDNPSATVVRELKAIARLETVALHVEKVVDVKDQQKRLLGMVDAQDAILFVASGEVILGVDLGKLRSEDVVVEPRTGVVTMTVPAPEVLSARFDEVRSYVHSRNTDVLARRNEALESFARREAIASFEAAGRDPANMERTKERAEKQLRSLAAAWGAKSLVIQWRQEGDGGGK